MFFYDKENFEIMKVTFVHVPENGTNISCIKLSDLFDNLEILILLFVCFH